MLPKHILDNSLKYVSEYDIYTKGALDWQAIPEWEYVQWKWQKNAWWIRLVFIVTGVQNHSLLPCVRESLQKYNVQYVWIFEKY